MNRMTTLLLVIVAMIALFLLFSCDEAPTISVEDTRVEDGKYNSLDNCDDNCMENLK